jgi:hypothetical protein
MQIPELKEAAQAAGISDEQIREAASSVTSVKVAARR